MLTVWVRTSVYVYTCIYSVYNMCLCLACTYYTCVLICTCACTHNTLHSPSAVLRWPNITEVHILKGRTAFNPLTIQWKIDNYAKHSEYAYLSPSFYQDDGTMIDPHQDGFSLHNTTCDVTSRCIWLTLPLHFEGHIELRLGFTDAVITKDTGFSPVSKKSDRVTSGETMIDWDCF